MHDAPARAVADLDELVDGAARFLDLHLDALARWPALAPGRADEAARALLDGVDAALRDAVAAADAALDAALAPATRAPAGRDAPTPAPRDDPAAVAAEAALALSGDASARLAAARGALAKRLDEVTGTLFAYRQALAMARLPPDDPAAAADSAERVRAGQGRAHRGAALLVDAMRAWRGAAREALGGERAARAPAGTALDALAAAREALARGAARAALPALALALERAFRERVFPDAAAGVGLGEALDAWRTLGAPLPAPEDALRAFAAALADARAGDDAVVAWRLHDAAERLVHATLTTPFPPDARARAAGPGGENPRA